MNWLLYVEIIALFVEVFHCDGFQPFRSFPNHSAPGKSCRTTKKFLPLMVTNRELFNEPPFLALITEPDACIDDERAEATLAAITRAIETSKVNLVSIRLTKPSSQKTFPEVWERAVKLTKSLVQLAEKSKSFRVVCSSDWVDLAMEANAHGVHVKESHLPNIPDIRQKAGRDDFIIGTSTHSIQSAIQSFVMHFPDYYFVGTCFLTASHPEKSSEDLEGPTLPGHVRKTLREEANKAGSSCPIVFAIGGIDETNCHIPVSYGADGVAVIRAILQAQHPSQLTLKMHEQMQAAIPFPDV